MLNGNAQTSKRRKPTMKRALRLCSLAFLFALLFSFAFAEETKQEIFTSGDYKYIVLPDGTVEITYYSGKDEQLSIPDNLGEKKVTSINTNALYPDLFDTRLDNIKSISLPNGIFEIDETLFQFCNNLTDIMVNDNHPNLATINGVLFLKNEKKLLCYPCGREETLYEIPYGTEIIGKNAFHNCKNLLKITIPDTIINIDAYAFGGCENLKSILIPNSVKKIADYAFHNCTNIENILIPDSVVSLGANPFLYCRKLININVSPDHSTYASIDGVLFQKQEKTLISYPYGKTASTYLIPQGILRIGESAFEGNEQLVSVIIPDSVLGIDKRGFGNCKNLSSIFIPDNVNTIENRAFVNCRNLREVTLPKNLKSIEESVFLGCELLTNISIPNNVTSIGKSAFDSCTNLISITIPDNVVSIGTGAFFWCENLTNVIIPDSVKDIGRHAFSNNPNLTIQVQKDSYAAQYCKENNLNYTYPDSLDWLNN